MKKVSSDIVIIGAGLTGLALAYFLKEQNLTVGIIEARDRIGGRIHTRYNEDASSIELGATWLGMKHTALTGLLDELGIATFEQILGETAIYEPMSINPPQIVQLPANEDPSFRIKGGTSELIRRLVDKIDTDRLFLNQAISSIEQKEKMIARSSTSEFKADLVISTLPPYLFKSTIKVFPQLPEALVDVAKQTHTWMGDSIKVGLTYEKPFWRDGNMSGTIFSNVGPIPEMYDHSNYENNKFALKGFFNGSYHSVSKAERIDMVLNQLKKYFGDQVKDYLTYEETVWSKEKYTYLPYESYVLPHQNNGHHIYRQGYLDGHLFLGGSETAEAHPGYMDGAIVSAKYLCSQVKEFFQL